MAVGVALPGMPTQYAHLPDDDALQVKTTSSVAFLVSSAYEIEGLVSRGALHPVAVQISAEAAPATMKFMAFPWCDVWREANTPMHLFLPIMGEASTPAFEPAGPNLPPQS
jgi:hypothetical protein